MNVATRRRVVVAGVALTAVGAATLGAVADTSTVPVTVAVANGTRTLTVTDPAGAAIGSGGLALGQGHAGAFLVNVTDKAYAHSGYQVSATMTNLYPYANGSYDFTSAPIPSSRVSVGYPGGLLGLANVKSLVTPVLSLSGNLGLLGTISGVSADGITQPVQTLADSVTQSTLASVLAQLPVTMNSGETGAFTNPADLPNEPGTPHANPTQRVVMSGDAQSTQALLDALTSALNTTYAGKTGQQLVDAGLIDENTLLTAVAGQLGLVPALLTSTQISAILNGVTATVTGILGGSVLGQTGTYSALPALSIDLPSTAATGLYRGQLVVTLMDK